MTENYETCCFCGKTLMSASERNNADPIVDPDEHEIFGCCCNACNNKYVKPARRILWKKRKER